jgi:hypothetical protein
MGSGWTATVLLGGYSSFSSSRTAFVSRITVRAGAAVSSPAQVVTAVRTIARTHPHMPHLIAHSLLLMSADRRTDGRFLLEIRMKRNAE